MTQPRLSSSSNESSMFERDAKGGTARQIPCSPSGPRLLNVDEASAGLLLHRAEVPRPSLEALGIVACFGEGLALVGDEIWSGQPQQRAFTSVCLLEGLYSFVCCSAMAATPQTFWLSRCFRRIMYVPCVIFVLVASQEVLWIE